MGRGKIPWESIARISANLLMVVATFLFLSISQPLGLICIAIIILFNISFNKAIEEMLPEQEAAPADDYHTFDEPNAMEIRQTFQPASHVIAPASSREMRFPAVPNRQPDWTFQKEDLCVLSGQEPPEGAFQPGYQVFFLCEPDNSHDHRAVRFVNAFGVQGGYLYRGQRKELIYDSLDRGDTVVGKITAKVWNGDYEATIDVYKSYPHTDLDIRAAFCVAGHSAIARRIRDAREARGLTQTAAAEAAGISRNLFGRYERGECVNVKLEDIDRIADALGVSADWIMDREQH